jgi:hypothetical protein
MSEDAGKTNANDADIPYYFHDIIDKPNVSHIDRKRA